MGAPDKVQQAANMISEILGNANVRLQMIFNILSH